MQEAEEKIAEIKALCDLITAQPLSNEAALKGFMFENWTEERKILKIKSFRACKKYSSRNESYSFPSNIS